MNEKEKKLLRAWSLRHGIALSDKQIHLLKSYLDELWVWNQRINLTGLSSVKGIISELLLDSILPTSIIPDHGRYLDVGSGAGFPAIPMKICNPQLDVQLIEANAKRISFLKHVIRLTGLSTIEVIRGRVEKSGRLLHPEGYEMITARALADFPTSVKWCVPNLISGGFFISFQGRHIEGLLRKNEKTVRQFGLVLHHTIPYTLPGMAKKRHILIFKKS